MWIVIYKKDTREIIRTVEQKEHMTFGYSEDCEHAIVENKPEGKYFEGE